MSRMPRGYRRFSAVWVLVGACLVAPWAEAQDPRLAEHVYKGVPACAHLFLRNGYVLCYDPPRRVPSWVSYHLVPGYLETPPRVGACSLFHADPAVPDPVKPTDYNGLLKRRGYARGHLAPYACMGGDRDRDGAFAPKDKDDLQTIAEANQMSNIAPQHQDAFNGSGGLWFKLERFVQDVLVRRQHRQVWVVSGCLFGRGEPEKVGPHRDIHVPPMFFEVIAWEEAGRKGPAVLAFLLPHQHVAHGTLEDFLVSVDAVEAMTGLDFFSELDDAVEAKLEDAETWTTWTRIAGAQPRPSG